MTGFVPSHPRNSGDAWVEGPDGHRFWGRYGAAGLLVHDPVAGILLQHRAEWSHFGGTWGLPGGARHEGETAVAGALREAHEEAGVPTDAIELGFTSVLDLGYWSYVTVASRASHPFEPRIGDAESLELRWVPVDDVAGLPLHPGFGSSWPALRDRLGRRIRIVVDAANVVGSRPDGWWNDRLGANERLLERLRRLVAAGLDVAELSEGADLPPGRVWADVNVVVEGAAREARSPEASAPSLTPVLGIVRAPGSGDDAIVEEVGRAMGETGGSVVVVTADRELSGRAGALGASVRGPGWLLRLLDSVEGADPREGPDPRA
jgi:8-oxo-dGTP pyrophosphatase MutT (NUDIX family)